MDKARVYIWLASSTAGLILLGYGIFARSVMIYEPPAGTHVGGIIPAFSEPAPYGAVPETRLILEVSRGGLTRDDAGRLVKTYEGDRPPKACPT